jgi:hypothetical protein
MASLKIKNGTRHEVKKGFVHIEGNCVMLLESIPMKNSRDSRIVFVYCLTPGETVTCDGEDYVVEF